MEPIIFVATIFLSYFIGSLSFAYLVSLRLRRGDIRKLGSGNAGALNVGREIGTKWGLIVFCLDFSKGYITVVIANALLDGLVPGVICAGVAVAIGHICPVYLRYKGGKGVAPAMGVMLAVLPVLTLISFAVVAIAFIVTRNAIMVIASGIISLDLLILITWQSPWYILLCITLSLLVLISHVISIRKELVLIYHSRRWKDIFSLE